MDSEHEDKVGMFKKVQTFLNNSAAGLTDTPIIASTIKPQIDAKLTAILEEDEDATAPISGSTVEKHEARLALEERGFAVAAGVASYYTITENNAVLRAKCDYTRSALERMRDTDLYVNLSRVHEIADPVKALLAPFGVTDVMVDDLQTVLTEFFDVLQNPKDAIGSRSASGKQVIRLIGEMDGILQSGLDVVMRHYQVGNPEIYDYYLSARAIDQSGGGAQPDEQGEGTVDSSLYYNTGVAAPEVTVNSRIIFKNTSGVDVDLRVSFSFAENNDGPTTIVVPRGEDIDVLASQLGFSGVNDIFLIHNPGTPTAATASFTFKLFY